MKYARIKIWNITPAGAVYGERIFSDRDGAERLYVTEAEAHDDIDRKKLSEPMGQCATVLKPTPQSCSVAVPRAKRRHAYRRHARD